VYCHLAPPSIIIRIQPSTGPAGHYRDHQTSGQPPNSSTTRALRLLLNCGPTHRRELATRPKARTRATREQAARGRLAICSGSDPCADGRTRSRSWSWHRRRTSRWPRSRNCPAAWRDAGTAGPWLRSPARWCGRPTRSSGSPPTSGHRLILPRVRHGGNWLSGIRQRLSRSAGYGFRSYDQAEKATGPRPGARVKDRVSSLRR
jgi:hypothetical protein